MKNTHLEHPEDSILTGDLSVLDWFSTNAHLSVKMDGAPAIVAGINPENGKRFVGTKSVFNKVKIKINHWLCLEGRGHSASFGEWALWDVFNDTCAWTPNFIF